jgi:hypothetical protein
MFLSAPVFAGRAILSIGIEKDENIYKSCSTSVRIAHIKKIYGCYILFGNACHLRSFVPATIVMAYDGLHDVQADIHTEHYDIHHALFSSPTVRVVVSTKLTPSLFRHYFRLTNTIYSSWYHIRLPGLRFASTSHSINLWFRKIERDNFHPLHYTSLMDQKFESIVRQDISARQTRTHERHGRT